MNVKLLRKIQKHILAEPKRLAMSDWIQHKAGAGDKAFYDDGKLRSYPKCGTVCCIAGWAITLSRSDEDTEDTNEGYPEHAKRLLGISKGYQLFVESGWPVQFSEAYSSATTLKARAKIAAARIEHFIKTKGRE